MDATTTLMTADELLRLPRGRARYELVKGELRTMAPSGFEHGVVGIKLTTPLDQYVTAHRLGVVVGNDIGFFLSRNPDTVRAPDLAFVSQARLESVGGTKKYWPGAPDLAVEVISPNDLLVEVEENVQEWLDAGTRLVWVINPRRRTVSVHAGVTRSVVSLLTEADDLDGQDVVPGFRIKVADLFVPQQGS